MFLSPIDSDLYYIGLNKIAGCDEVGRGCGGGPVVTACVMLPPNHKIVGIKDSKKLSPKRRSEIAQEIYERALEVHIEEMSNVEIDRYGIGYCTRICIKRSVYALKIKPDIVVVDGDYTFTGELSLPYLNISVPKADNNSENVAAASIVAKVYRDEKVKSMAEMYPNYGFENHVGYLTKEHIEALYKYGPTPYHRMSFSINGVSISSLRDRSKTCQ